MDMNELAQIERAASFGRSEMARLGSALLFIVGIMLFANTFIEGGTKRRNAGGGRYDRWLYGGQYRRL